MKKGFPKSQVKSVVLLRWIRWLRTMHALPLPESCVQISPSSHLPDKITLNLNGSLWKQAIAYDWKPKACIDCNTFSHESSSCPHNLNPVRQTRGRCRSRPPRPQLKRNTTTSTPNTLYAPLPNSSIPSFANPTLNDLSQPSILSPTIPNLLDDHILLDDDGSGNESPEVA